MSFDQNDMNNKIHLGNYEEFFILYMDNELNEEQARMVDEFLEVHSDLKAEFEALMNTKLPIEKFSFTKEDLLSDKMKMSSVDDELLLYLDNELSAEQKNKVELELAFNKDYRLQHQLLLQTRLDPSEKIVYPNKEELYRRTERVVVMAVWMRVAAAVIIIAAAGLLYLRNNSLTGVPIGMRSGTTAAEQTKTPNSPQQKTSNSQFPSTNSLSNQNLATSNSFSGKKNNSKTDLRKRFIKEEKSSEQPLIAHNQPGDNYQEDNSTARTPVTNVPISKTVVDQLKKEDDVNSTAVTSLLPDRNIVVGPSEPTPENRRGSVKGFLRKATRVIEKRTGFDPTNENGELLIGAVAISLK
jgi:hypothetical protein